MADFARYLPLSQRSPDEERGVTSDRKVQIADVVREAARLINAGGPERRCERVADFLATARLDRELKPLGSPQGATPDDLVRIADGIRGGRKRSLRGLAHAVRAVLHVGSSVGEEPHLDTALTGSVALWGSGAAPLERRAAIQGHTVRATDADWAFGFGPILEGRSIDIAAFLLGQSEHPPWPAPPAPPDHER